MKTLLTLLLFIPTLTHAARSELTASELERLKRGEEITRVEEMKGEPFPRVTLISVIPHSPRENMKTFTDFENHRKFIPGLLKSKVVAVQGNSTDVAFEMDMPIVKNTKYTTRNTVVYEGDSATLTWDLVKSDEVKKTRGMVRFEAFEGKTLFTYTTHITPNSSFAWAVKSRVVPDVKKNIEAVKNHLAKNAAAVSAAP